MTITEFTQMKNSDLDMQYRLIGWVIGLLLLTSWWLIWKENEDLKRELNIFKELWRQGMAQQSKRMEDQLTGMPYNICWNCDGSEVRKKTDTTVHTYEGFGGNLRRTNYPKQIDICDICAPQMMGMGGISWVKTNLYFTKDKTD